MKTTQLELRVTADELSYFKTAVNKLTGISLISYNPVTCMALISYQYDHQLYALGKMQMLQEQISKLTV